MKYFNHREFDSPDLPNSGINMDETFLIMLDNARSLAGVPFNINSGYRTQAHNLKVGGSPNSSHMLGLAADIRCTDSSNRYFILNSLLDAGFTRIGIYQNFIHVDLDNTKVQNVIWYL